MLRSGRGELLLLLQSLGASGAVGAQLAGLLREEVGADVAVVDARAVLLRVRDAGHAVGGAVDVVVDHGGEGGGEVVAARGAGHGVEALIMAERKKS